MRSLCTHSGKRLVGSCCGHSQVNGTRKRWQKAIALLVGYHVIKNAIHLLDHALLSHTRTHTHLPVTGLTKNQQRANNVYCTFSSMTRRCKYTAFSLIDYNNEMSYYCCVGPCIIVFTLWVLDTTTPYESRAPT